ncbi:MAG: hypothetical protein ACPHFX_05695 [Paracoccaceae bacterium]
MTHVLDIEFETMDGTTTSLRELGGSRWLVVNVASACGATPQYAGLQDLHEQHEDLTVVGFPCNQFGAQEPGTHAEICEFTSSKYNVTFPLMAPISIGAIIIRLIEASKIMDTVYVLTSGGPGTATETSSFYIFIKGLREFQFGYSAALSLTYLIIMIISFTIIAKILVKLMVRGN